MSSESKEGTLGGQVQKGSGSLHSSPRSEPPKQVSLRRLLLRGVALLSRSEAWLYNHTAGLHPGFATARIRADSVVFPTLVPARKGLCYKLLG